MKKIAIFVEGQTDLIFIENLVRNVFGHAKINLETIRFSGKEGLRRICSIRLADTASSAQYLFRIYDCHGGGENSTVKSDIHEQFNRLLEESFSYIIGIRDVYPLTDTNKLKTMMKLNLPENEILPIKIILAVMEIEGWFLAEENHYSQIDSALTIPLVNSIIGFDITTTSTETIERPSLSLKQVYQKASKDYKKKRWEAERTVHALDYDNLYLAVRNRNDSLKELLTCLDGLVG